MVCVVLLTSFSVASPAGAGQPGLVFVVSKPRATVFLLAICFLFFWLQRVCAPVGSVIDSPWSQSAALARIPQRFSPAWSGLSSASQLLFSRARFSFARFQCRRFLVSVVCHAFCLELKLDLFSARDSACPNRFRCHHPVFRFSAFLVTTGKGHWSQSLIPAAAGSFFCSCLRVFPAAEPFFCSLGLSL
jgi:hypothetical protein